MEAAGLVDSFFPVLTPEELPQSADLPVTLKVAHLRERGPGRAFPRPSRRSICRKLRARWEYLGLRSSPRSVTRPPVPPEADPVTSGLSFPLRNRSEPPLPALRELK